MQMRAECLSNVQLLFSDVRLAFRSVRRHGGAPHDGHTGPVHVRKVDVQQL